LDREAEIDPAFDLTVPVNIAGSPYEIRIGEGLLDTAGPEIAALGGQRAAIVTDATVAALHLDRLRASIAAAGVEVIPIVLPPGEGTKNFNALEELCGSLLDARVERNDIVVALGGGVIGDLAGFASSVLRRGVRCVQVPTTLLAQVDSSVGGKTGINTRHGKNLIGAFHQPSLVLADSDVLDTLPVRDFRAGYAEVAKYGLVNDPAFFAWLEAHWPDVFAGGPARMKAIATSCASKAAIVARDERETGERALLNLGHTFGHALEAAVGFDAARLVHGEAVGIGIVLAFDFSVALGLAPAGDARRVREHFRNVGLPTRISDVPGLAADADRLVALMGQDKKVKRSRLTFILAKGIGQSFIAEDVPPEKVREFLRGEIAADE